MRIVLDSNVWISGTFWKGEANKLFNLIKEKQIVVVISSSILLEIANVLAREEKFKIYYDRNDIEKVLSKMVPVLTIIEPQTRLNIIKDDPSDNIILECAIDGNADYIVTYDKHLLELKEYECVKIVSVGDILKKI